MQKKLAELLKKATKTPHEKTGLLFSGGIDSLVIAKILKEKNADFVCYTAGASENSSDLIRAKKIARDLNLNLKTKIVSEEETEKYIKKIIKLIGTSNVVKVGIALPIYVASEMANKDNIKKVYTGTGADELLGGYNRYKNSENLNEECKKDIEELDKRNIFLDKIFKHFKLEHLTPYLDSEVVSFGLEIPAKQKIKNNIEKYILKKAAKELGIPENYAERKKKAAQYGSGFDKVIKKLARPKSKTEYLNSFFKIGSMVSSGKDGLYACYLTKKQGYNVNCLLTMKSKNKESYMFHTPNVDLVKLQAESMDLPLVEHTTKGVKEEELEDLEELIKKAVEKHKIQGITTGALFSEYQASRIQKICDKLDLKVFSPLWHMNQEKEMRNLLNEGFEIIFSSIAAYGLDKTWVGRKITEEDVDKLVELNKKYGVNVAGEGGETESLVLNCLLFKKPIKILDSEIIEQNECTARLKIKKAKLKS